MEYYTYNGFTPIVSAFTKLALVFSDGTYHAFFFAVIVLSILFGSAAAYFSAKQGRPSPLSWVMSTLAGVIFYFSLIVPTGTLHIYDPVKNQYQPVGGVPDGIILVAGYLNLIERGLIDIVSIAGDPVGYQAQAGGVGFDMLLNVHSKGVLLQDQYLHQSLKKYIEDCVFFELNRPGTTLTINQLSNNPDFTPLFDTAASPSIFTVFYNNATPQGVTVSCNSANTQIKTAIAAPTQFANTTRSRCAEAGFDPTIPLEYTTCQTMFSDLVSWLEGSAFSITQIYRQKLIADEINNVVLSTSPDTAIKILGSRNTGTAMLSSGVMANEWIPIIRAVTTSLAIGIIPIIFIFIPTPLFLRALGLLLAFFIWLTSWGVTDAIAHQFAIDHAMTVFEEIRQYQLGITAISSFGTGSLKTLAAFGAIRWSGLLMATVITTTIMKVGGHALSYLASSQTGMAKTTGEKVGEVTKPEGAASTLNAVEQAPPVMANAHKFDFNQRTTARTNTGAKSIGSGLGLGDQKVAFATGKTESEFSVGTVRGRQEFADETTRGNLRTAGQQAEHMERSTRFGRAKGESDFGKQVLGLDTPSETATFNATGKLITPDIANFAKNQGHKGVVPDMRLTGASFDSKTGEVSQMSFSGPVTNDNIAALKDIATANGHTAAAQFMKPGMIASFDINPQTGKGKFNATDNTAVNSEDFGESTIPTSQNGFTIETPQGSFKLKSGKVQMLGNQVYVNGTSTDNQKVQFEGSLNKGFSGPSGQSSFNSDKDVFEFDSNASNDGGSGTGLVKDSSGNLTHLGLNVSRGEVGKGIFRKEILGPKGLEALADQINSEKGPNHVANALRATAAAGQSAEVTSSSSAASGKLTNVSVTSGGTATATNFSSSRSGMEAIFKTHRSETVGSSFINEDVSKQVVDHGIQLGSTAQMALNNDSRLAAFISDPGMATFNPKGFDANVATTARSLATDMKSFLVHEGDNFGHTSTEAGGSVPMPGVVGRTTIGGSKHERETVDLLTAKYDQLIRSSYTEGTKQNLNQGQMAAHITNDISRFTNEIYGKARTSNPDQFGADSAIGITKDAAEAANNLFKPKNP